MKVKTTPGAGGASWGRSGGRSGFGAEENMQDRPRPRLLVIDDQAEVCDSIQVLAQRHGFEVVTAQRPREFHIAVETFAPNVIMIDIVMPEMDGVEILKQLAARGCDARIIMMTGYNDSYLHKAVDLGHGLGLASVSSLHKPFGADTLYAALAGGADMAAQTLLAS